MSRTRIELYYMPPFPPNCLLTSTLLGKPTYCSIALYHFATVSTMASGFPPPNVREIASEVSVLLKERSETVCVAETVRSASSAFFMPLSRNTTNG